jgi:hypothetical protein
MTGSFLTSGAAVVLLFIVAVAPPIDMLLIGGGGGGACWMYWGTEITDGTCMGAWLLPRPMRMLLTTLLLCLWR